METASSNRRLTRWQHRMQSVDSIAGQCQPNMRKSSEAAGLAGSGRPGGSRMTLGSIGRRMSVHTGVGGDELRRRHRSVTSTHQECDEHETDEEASIISTDHRHCSLSPTAAAPATPTGVQVRKSSLQMLAAATGVRKAKDWQASAARCFELRRDHQSRAKHFKFLMESISDLEKQAILEEYAFETFHLLMELSLMSDYSTGGKSGPQGFELNFALEMLEQLVLYVPDLLAEGWQFEAIRTFLHKCLQPNNANHIKWQAVKIFLLWYQILGANNKAVPVLENMLINLLPGASWERSNRQYMSQNAKSKPSSTSSGNSKHSENESNSESARVTSAFSYAEANANYAHLFEGNLLNVYLEKCLFKHLLSETSRVLWKSKVDEHHYRSARFIFDKLKLHFLPACFPSELGGIKAAELTVAELQRILQEQAAQPLQDQEAQQQHIVNRYYLIRWLVFNLMDHSSASNSLGLSQSLQQHHFAALNRHPSESSPAGAELVRKIILEESDNLLLTLSLFRQALLLPIRCSALMILVLKVIRQWMQQPPAMLKQDTLMRLIFVFYFNGHLRRLPKQPEAQEAAGGSSRLSSTVAASNTNHRILALIKDVANPQRTQCIEVNWRQLLDYLLMAVHNTLPEDYDQANQFAKAVGAPIFQALLVSWIFITGVRLVHVPVEMWDKLYHTLQKRRNWTQLVDEWTKVMTSVTRALAQYFYQVDLLDLPLERVSERRRLRAATTATTPRPHTLNMDDDDKHNGAKDLLDPSEGGTAYDFCSPLLSAGLTEKEPLSGTHSSPLTSATSVDRKSLQNGLSVHDKMPLARSPAGIRSAGATSIKSFAHSMSSAGCGDAAERTSLKESARSMDAGSSSGCGDSVPQIDVQSVSSGTGSAKLDAHELTLNNSSAQLHNESENEVFAEELPVEDVGADSATGTAAEVDLTPREEDVKSVDIGKIWLLIWRRLLVCVDNVQTLCATVDTLIKVRANQPSSPPYMPPFNWLRCRLLSLCARADNSDADLMSALKCLTKCVFMCSRSDEHIPAEQVSVLCALLLRQLRAHEQSSSQAHTSTACQLIDALCPHMFYEYVCGVSSVLVGDCYMVARAVLQSSRSSLPAEQTGSVLKATQLLALLCSAPHTTRSSIASFSDAAAHLLLESLQSAQGRAAVIARNALALYLCAHKQPQHAHMVQHGLLNIACDETSPAAAMQVCENMAVLCSPHLPWPEQQPLVDMHSVVNIFCDALVSMRCEPMMECVCVCVMQCLVDMLVLHPASAPQLARCVPTVTHALEQCAQDVTSQGSECAQRVAVVADSLLCTLTKCLHQFPPAQFSVAQLSSTDFCLESQSLLIARQPGLVWTVHNEPGADAYCDVDGRSGDGRVLWRVQSVPACVPAAVALPLPTSSISPFIEQRRRQSIVALDSNKPSTSNAFRDMLDELASSSPECFEDDVERSELRLPMESDIVAEMRRTSAQPQPSSTAAADSSSAKPKRKLGVLKQSDSNVLHSLVGSLRLCDYDENTSSQRLVLPLTDAARRHLKHVDHKLWERDVHKIALIYVGRNQDDRAAILGNEHGSPLFDAFVSAVGWQVDLRTHAGYTAGLPRDGTTSYYATACTELVWHVSTALGAEPTRKWRHLGNDHVHVVWSEHIRDYHRGIITTEFADVLIVIYPLLHNLFRIAIDTRAAELMCFGPLFDGAIVHWKSLATLVRETALNASRAKHRQMEAQSGHVRGPPAANRTHAIEQLSASGTGGRKPVGSQLPDKYMYRHVLNTLYTS